MFGVFGHTFPALSLGTRPDQGTIAGRARTVHAAGSTRDARSLRHAWTGTAQPYTARAAIG